MRARPAGWDGFTAIFTPPEAIDVPGLSVKPRRFAAKLAYHDQRFASVPIEVSMVEAGNAESFDAVSWDALALVGVPAAVTVPCMTVDGRSRRTSRLDRDNCATEVERPRP